MYKVNKTNVPKRERDGLTSFIFLQKQDNLSEHLAITWVEVEKGAEQALHHHFPEQVYIITQGQGIMTVESESQKVMSGDMVFIPSGQQHAIKNTGEDKLIYISASSPTFDFEKLYDDGLLKQK